MKKNIIRLLLIAIVVISLTSCGEDKDISVKTIYYNGRAEPIGKPLPLMAPGFEDLTVSTLCFSAEQSYPNLTGEVKLPFDSIAQRVLARIGIEVVSEGDACEASFAITIIGYSSSGTYESVGTCYTGAEVEGEATFSVPNQEPLTLPIDRVLPGRGSVLEGQCESSPTSKFIKPIAFEELLNIMYQLWGPLVVVKTDASGFGELFEVRLAADALLEEIWAEESD